MKASNIDFMQIIECVPNFSEGRDKNIIEAIAGSIKQVEGVKLLDVDPGYDANRTVMTFAGGPEHVFTAAFEAIQTATRLIDMSKHTGTHPRSGAADVCPFVPISGIDMDELTQMSHQFGEKVAKELSIPIYFYGHSAKKTERENLAWIRKGEYENLPIKMEMTDFAPDFGDPAFNPKSGICTIGAREFLLAYNVNLQTKDIAIAKKIAELIRSSSKNSQYSLLHLKAIGWYIADFDKVQVSMNITNFNETPIHMVYETSKKLAESYGTEVTGSELVGMSPLSALTACGTYYLKSNKKHHHLPHSELVVHAIKYLGLEEVKSFDPSKKIIEYALGI